mmetsp:Transcript_26670/g.37586  ORF Transcript_26670/g.37586 Transcript_26670/m.37586 type:complete len:326 (+) Transcript_26670:202-1179(+)
MSEDTGVAPDGTMSSSRSPRFTLWVAFLIFSTITMGSAVEIKRDSYVQDALDDRAKANQKWAIACSAITFALTFVVVLMHVSSIASVFIVGTKLEGAVCIILAAFWAATVAIVSDSSNDLAVDSAGQVKNGNLYYFSWAGFVTSVVLCVSYLRGVFGVDVAGEIRSRSARLTTWSALLASSLVVMGTSANIFDQKCTGDKYMEYHEDAVYCTRTKFAISLGAIVTSMSLVIVGMKIATTTAPFMAECIMALLSTILYAFGVAFVTSAKGPGSPLGNLYYFTWISFLSGFLLSASCVEDWGAIGSPGQEEEEGEGDIQVETLNDAV